MRAWIARDIDGEVCLYENKPIKTDFQWMTGDEFGRYFPVLESDLSEGINPKWEDDEPIEVNLKIEKL